MSGENPNFVCNDQQEMQQWLTDHNIEFQLVEHSQANTGSITLENQYQKFN